MLEIAVIGAGVNGIASAIKILEHYKNVKQQPVQVTVLSDEFSPNTTGDGSAGLWGPYLLGGTEQAKIYKWSKHMHDFLQEIWLSVDAGEAGVCLLPCVRLTTSADAQVEDFWSDIVYGAANLTPQQLQEYNKGRAVPFTSGLSFITYTSEPVKLLPYLMKRIVRQGGRLVRQKVEDLDNFIRDSSYDVIINCTGLGAKQLLCDDKMYAVRGQVIRVKAQWAYAALLDESDDGNYIIPNTDSVVLGGTHQKGDYNTQVSPKDKQFIIDGCRSLVPALTHAPHLRDWVGLRPGRVQLRLELERRGQKLLIHNYGHGGSGVTLAWGCGQEVLELLEGAQAKSKL